MPIFTLKLIEKREIAQNMLAFRFEKPAGFTFIPGQYGGFTLINPPETDAGGNTRRFSLLSTPDDAYLEIGTRIQQSAYKRVLSRLPIGGEIKFAGPTGNFILHDDPAIPAVFIAGGIGIAPFYSMIRDAARHQAPRQIILFYGNQSPDTTAFLSELTQIEKNYAGFKLTATFDKPASDWQGETGFISHTMIKKYVQDIHQPYYYICGAPAMVTALQETVAEMGVDASQVKVEDFPGY